MPSRRSVHSRGIITALKRESPAFSRNSGVRTLLIGGRSAVAVIPLAAFFVTCVAALGSRAASAEVWPLAVKSTPYGQTAL